MSGRWFEPGEEFVCLLPNDLAELVGIFPEDAGTAKIEMQGQIFTVIGILDSEMFNKFKDLDDEKLTPVDTVKEKRRFGRCTGSGPAGCRGCAD